MKFDTIFNLYYFFYFSVFL